MTDLVRLLHHELDAQESAVTHAISVRQLWAWLIAEGIKLVENRDNAKRSGTPSIIGQARKMIGQRIAIQASVGFTRTEMLAAFSMLCALPETGSSHECSLLLDLIRDRCGHVIATAVIDRVICHGDGDPMNEDRWRTADRYAIVLRDVVKVRPVKAKGQLGLWRLPEDVVLVPVDGGAT